MSKIHIKDIESLNKLNSDILKLKKNIEELQQIKELKNLQQEEKILKNKIVKYSTYDSVQIVNIMTKLMTVFEGIEYVSISNFFYSDYCIEPKSNNRDIINIYPFYKINNIKQERLFFDTSEKKERCYLPPSTSFSQNISSPHHSQNKNIEYIQLFIDYLYEKRLNKALEEISEKELEKILQEFLEISIELQQQRKKEIEEKIKEQIQEQKRREFEKSCVINRELILNSLKYIINHYEENMSAKLEKYEKWYYRSPQRSELTGFHKLTITYDDREVCFESVIDSYSCYPDEEYEAHVDMNKQTDICFFELKHILSPVFKNSNYILGFMNSIEKMYSIKQNITATAQNINQLLVDISNKSKQKVLKQ